VPDTLPGKWLKLNVSNGAVGKTLLTTGAPLALASNWLKSNSQYSDYSLYSMPLWGMKWKSMQQKEVLNWQEVIVVEDHLLDGGFGSWLMESLINNPKLLSQLRFKNLDSSICGAVAKQETLNSMGGLIG
jgi:transketolase